jgi:hypothetical protein
MALEERPRSASVLAENEVGFAQLAQSPESHVLEVPDRGRDDDERHR